MTPEQTKEAFQKLFQVAKDYGGNGVERLPEKFQNVKRSEIGSMSVVIDHLMFMGLEGQRLVTAGKTEKAMRWLGFLQGVEWALNLVTLEELKRMNMPPEEQFDGKRI